MTAASEGGNRLTADADAHANQVRLDAGPSTLVVKVRKRGLIVVGHEDEPLDVLFDGRRIWSFVPSRQGRRRGEGRYLVPWPKALRARLDGVVTTTVEALESGARAHCGEVKFGTGRGRVNLVDELGQPVRVDKASRLERSFETADEDERASLLDGVQKTLDVLTQRGVPAFLAFGCLLGAVRSGKLIGHDNDADIAYYSEASHPFDVMLESLTLERHFIRLGWRTLRMQGGYFKVYPPASGGEEVAIDIFSAWHRGPYLYVVQVLRVPVPRSTILPLSTVTLEGRTVLAPADPPALLEATYGPGWRVPDPTFKFRPPHATRRTLGAWTRGGRLHQRFWHDSYANGADVSPGPSAFARWVAEQEPPGALLDVGSGTGRDSLYFAERGFRVTGCDYAASGLERGRERARQQGLSNVDFLQLNLYDLRHVLARGALMAGDCGASAVYSRAVVDALTDHGRRNLLLLSRAALRDSTGRLYLEYFTERPRGVLGAAYWKRVQPEVVVDELVSFGFSIEHREEVPTLSGDPPARSAACRIVARMS